MQFHHTRLLCPLQGQFGPSAFFGTQDAAAPCRKKGAGTKQPLEDFAFQGLFILGIREKSHHQCAVAASDLLQLLPFQLGTGIQKDPAVEEEKGHIQGLGTI